MHNPQKAMGDPLKGLGVPCSLPIWYIFPMAKSFDFKRIKNSDSSDFKRIEMGSFFLSFKFRRIKNFDLILLISKESECQIFHLRFIFWLFWFKKKCCNLSYLERSGGWDIFIYIFLIKNKACLQKNKVLAVMEVQLRTMVTWGHFSQKREKHLKPIKNKLSVAEIQRKIDTLTAWS
jgi:hypothetical protein